jgi:(p)ppGpp synthase/HD superfamily hydrolase
MQSKYMNETFILKAAQFSSLKHRDQKRKDRAASPYINHPISVALVISEIGNINDPEILAAALLHDTLEDTETSPEELKATFGEKVCRMVEEVTDNKALSKAERKQRQIQHAAKLSQDAVLIKLGDKISNVIDVTNTPPADWSLKRRKEYLDWSEAVIENCPKVSKALEQHFAEVLKKGRRSLRENGR